MAKRDKPRQGGACMARCGSARGISFVIHRVKIWNISSSV